MENTHIKSWHGSDTLKQSVLLQMETHCERAVLEQIEIDSVLVEIYGWKNNIDYSVCAKILGLDEGVLQLGFYLWEGFPEDKKGIQTLIQLRMAFLESIPVGVNLKNICNEFIVWRLENADFGISDSEINKSVEYLLSEIVEAFYQDKPDMQVTQQKVELAIQNVTNNIRMVWQKERMYNKNASQTLNALETVAAACNAFVSPTSAADTAKAYIFGANGTNVRNSDEEMDIMSDKLLQLMQAAPKNK